MGVFIVVTYTMKIPEMMNDESELILNCLTGSITEEELSRLIEWIKKSPENKQQFVSLRNAWILAGYRQEELKEFPPSLLSSFRNAVDQAGEIPKPGKAYIFKYIRLAASWLLFLALGSLLSMWLFNKPQTVVTADANKKVEIHSPLGSRNRIVMPDSTTIWLNAGTTITYARDYGIVSRTVELDGEAYFDVMGDSKHPFIVHTKEVDIKALGTRFNVKAYSEEETITTTLEEGKINITVPGLIEKKETILLNPNENFIYHKAIINDTADVGSSGNVSVPEKTSVSAADKVSVISNVRTELYTSWKDSRWIIEREPFKTLVPKLERRYNIVILFQDPAIRDINFTGTVENESIDQLLDAIRFTAPVDCSMIKDTVRLYLDADAYEKFKNLVRK